MNHTNAKSNLKIIADTVKVISVVVGIVMSVLSFNAARKEEALSRRTEALRPYLDLHQKNYTDTVHVIAVLATPDIHDINEIQAAKKRFQELYVAELSMEEDTEVETNMVKFATTVDPSLLSFTPPQRAAYDLAHALRNSYNSTFGIEQSNIVNGLTGNGPAK